MMTKLPKAPLQEVIFEVRWELDIDPKSNQQYDKGYDLAVGSMRSLLTNDYKLVNRKIQSDIPAQLLLQQVVYQFRPSENLWPVIQLGPGIFAVNETEKNYEWESAYFPLIQKSLSILEQSYGYTPKYNYVTLRYIDSVKATEYGLKEWPEFVSKNLNFKFENQFDTKGKLKQFMIDELFGLEDGSDLHLAISNGKGKEKEDVFVWQSALIKSGSFTTKDIIDWVQFAHKNTSGLFKEITKKDFYGSFTKSKS